MEENKKKKNLEQFIEIEADDTCRELQKTEKDDD